MTTFVNSLSRQGISPYGSHVCPQWITISIPFGVDVGGQRGTGHLIISVVTLHVQMFPNMLMPSP
jgi:hypothetical protein